MFFSFVFACLCYYLTIVESNNGDRMYRPEIENIHGYEYENCPNEMFEQSFKEYNAKRKCQPRDAIVHLKSNLNDFTMVPNQVVVKRCYESGCYGKKSCTPVKSELISIPVYISSYQNGGAMECSWVNVTEHTSCKCKCLVKKEDCNDMQEYIPKDCLCSCKNKHEKKNCHNGGMIWNDTTCTCECHSIIMECSTGFEWVPRMCKCLRVLMPNTEYLDYENNSIDN